LSRKGFVAGQGSGNEFWKEYWKDPKHREEQRERRSKYLSTYHFISSELELTFAEIAKVVNKPMNTVKSQYRRAIITLKGYLS
jgi:hypothetical protein